MPDAIDTGTLLDHQKTGMVDVWFLLELAGQSLEALKNPMQIILNMVFYNDENEEGL